ncbi:HAD-IA family hydrolase [Fodinicurvata sp. EGI_FJ10296]|uniref:HAD-IA family hydrolase n=1 Tax=Fodinicurvata sp. EGI_FJ10296 TaxID=3231908 RepID=UPI0034570967
MSTAPSLHRCSRPDAAIFDLDGTLFHSAPGITECLNAVLEADARRRLTVGEATTMIGNGARVLLSRAYEATGGHPSPDDRGGMEARYTALADLLSEVPVGASDLYPGVGQTLARYSEAGIAMAVCTNKPEKAARHALDGLGIAGSFEMVIGGDSLAERKPHPMALTTILERLGTTPDRAVMIGDSITDLDTARAAGMACILVSFGYSRTPVTALGADRVVENFTDLTALLRE